MKPVDHVNPTVPSNWVRRVEERRRRQDPRHSPGQGQPGQGQNAPADRNTDRRDDPDGHAHLIDELV